MGGDGGEKEGRVTKSKHKTSKTLVVQTEDPVPVKQRVGSSFSSALPLRSLKVAKVKAGRAKEEGPINKTVRTVYK